jgi:hypothetical protein
MLVSTFPLFNTLLALLLPEGQNQMRMLQLRELAVLNGTIRPDDALANLYCTNCGFNGHKTWECPEALNFTANIVCPVCGAGGHLARDCLALRNSDIPIKPFDAEVINSSVYQAF